VGVRDGAAYIARLRQHPREVWIQGRRVADVTSDPLFRRPIEAIARLYDIQTDPEFLEEMTYRCEETGQRAGTSFLVPKNAEDLAKRRKAIKRWADATFGMVGRSPDFLNTTLMAFAESTEFFARGDEDYARNVIAYYKYCRDNDLFLTHAIVSPQTDRSRASYEQSDAFVHLGVVDETADGLIVRGAKMLATHGPIADELLVYPTPGSRTGDERYILAFGIPIDTPGLRLICREPFDDGRQSEWDHPLGARFEEPDAMIVFDDVLIPWNRVFLYGDVILGNQLIVQANLRNHTGHQSAIRALAKAQFVTGVAIAVTRSVKTDVFLHVQEQLGELLGYLHLIEGAIALAEINAEDTGHGSIRPAYNSLQALRYHFPKFYERMVQVTQVLGAGGLLINPTEADLSSQIGGDIERYYRGAGIEAPQRIHLSKLAWDVTGTQFAQRMVQYERYYAGDPVRVGAGFYLMQDVGPLLQVVERALRPSAPIRNAPPSVPDNVTPLARTR
jgi:4-hydroxyphenylacetate 3-monooxygenase oxygenase component